MVVLDGRLAAFTTDEDAVLVWSSWKVVVEEVDDALALVTVHQLALVKVNVGQTPSAVAHFKAPMKTGRERGRQVGWGVGSGREKKPCTSDQAVVKTIGQSLAEQGDFLPCLEQ